jgi:hypothetical protein
MNNSESLATLDTGRRQTKKPQRRKLKGPATRTPPKQTPGQNPCARAG